MSFTPYTNRRNPHVTIHLASCTQIAKRGGEHKHGQGEYHDHNSFEEAKRYAEQTDLTIIECSFCKPAGKSTP